MYFKIASLNARSCTPIEKEAITRKVNRIEQKYIRESEKYTQSDASSICFTIPYSGARHSLPNHSFVKKFANEFPQKEENIGDIFAIYPSQQSFSQSSITATICIYPKFFLVFSRTDNFVNFLLV